MKTRETTYNGQELGTSIKDTWELEDVACDHIEDETEKALKINGVWMPKSIIASLEWVAEEIAGKTTKTVRTVELPVWYIIKTRI